MTTITPAVRRTMRRTVTGLGFSAPWLIGLVFFSAGPIIASLYYSFTNADTLNSPQWVGLSNYQHLLHDPLFRQSLWQTLYLTVIGVPLSITLALLLALALNFPVRGQPLYRAIVYLPAIVPIVTTAFLWQWILNGESGFLDRALKLVGLPQPAWLEDPTWAKPGLILLLLWGIGGSAIIYLAALKQVPKQVQEAAAVDGANAWQRFWNVTWPFLSPVTLFLTIISCIAFLQIFTQPFVLSQGALPGGFNPTAAGPANSLLTYTMYLFQNAFIFYKMGYASAMAWILFFFIALFTAILFWTSRRWVHYDGTD